MQHIVQQLSQHAMQPHSEYNCAASRIIKNLCTMACGDPAETPDASLPDADFEEEPPISTSAGSKQPNGQSGAPIEQDIAAAAAATARMVRPLDPHQTFLLLSCITCEIIS